MELTKKSETASKITFTYDKPAGAVEGYVYYSDGNRVSKTMNPDDLEVTFGKVASGKYSVQAVGFNQIARAEWPKVAEPGPYSVTQNVVGDGGDISGTFAWMATPSDPATSKVEFMVDAVVKSNDTSSPWAYNLDTTTLSNGSHTWAVRATASDGRVATASTVVNINNETAPPPPPPPPPPPDGDVFFDGRFDTGNFSRWPALDMLSQGTVVDTPMGKTFRVKTTDSGVSMLNMGGDLQTGYMLPWELAPTDVWHGFTFLVPSGNHPSYPGAFRLSVAGEWDMVWELHNRTDAASGYNNPNQPGGTPGSYASTCMDIHDDNGTLYWRLRVSGNTLNNPINTYKVFPTPIQKDKVYKFQIRIKHGHTTATAFTEWWIDDVKVWESNAPNTYLCADGKTGERLQYGLYRGHASRGETNLYAGGLKVAATRGASTS
jgi:hypothetical protein